MQLVVWNICHHLLEELVDPAEPSWPDTDL